MNRSPVKQSSAGSAHLTALPQSWYYETVSQRGRFPEQRRAFIAKKQTHSRSSPAAGPRAYFCVFLARRESIWPGLALPILAGLYAVVMALSYTAAPDTPWNQVLGGVLAVFLVSGIPAFLLLMVFFICRSGRRRKKQLEKMNVQDL